MVQVPCCHCTDVLYCCTALLRILPACRAWLRATLLYTFADVASIHVLQRLRYEVDQPAEASSTAGAPASASATPTAASLAASPAAGAAAAGSGEAMLTEGGQQAAQQPAAAAQPPQKTVPYSRRLLLKSLLRAIAVASYAPGQLR